MHAATALCHPPSGQFLRLDDPLQFLGTCRRSVGGVASPSQDVADGSPPVGQLFCPCCLCCLLTFIRLLSSIDWECSSGACLPHQYACRRDGRCPSLTEGKPPASASTTQVAQPRRRHGRGPSSCRIPPSSSTQLCPGSSGGALGREACPRLRLTETQTFVAVSRHPLVDQPNTYTREPTTGLHRKGE